MRRSNQHPKCRTAARPKDDRSAQPDDDAAAHLTGHQPPGGVDAVGSTTLANVLSMTSYGGAIAACGLAGGMDLPASVAPFILRGVTLAGIDSVMAPRERREEAWARLAAELDAKTLESMVTETNLEGAVNAAKQLMEGRMRGRVVVRL